jgi:hypothetical protein
MVATFSKLYHLSTVVAPFPALLFAEFKDSLCVFIVVTFSPSVPLHVAFFTDFRLACLALPDFSASHFVLADVLGLYPNATTLLGTVQSILSSVFCKFPVPENLEFDIEDLVNMFQRNLLFCAAPRWHELWIGCR